MATTTSPSRLETSVRGVLEPIVAGLGVDLVDLEVKGPPNRRVVRLFVDVPPSDEGGDDADGGLDIDRIADISRAVSDALDEADTVNGSYTLEVSSPGVDRPMTTARDFARQVGRDVRLALTAEDADDVVGTLTATTAITVTVQVAGADQTIPLADVDHGRVELPW